MKRALFVVLAVALLITVVAPIATTAQADGPWGYGKYGYGYVFPDSGYNKVCMYSYWNCSYRFVPPYPVSGWYKYPYNTWVPAQQKHYNPNWCQPGLLCNSGW